LIGASIFIDASLLVAIFAMLLVGTILGEFIKRLGFSPLIGQMISGIVLGPMALNLVSQSKSMDLLAGIGVLFMMFLMGLSIDIEKVMGENVYKYALISILGGSFAFLSTAAITALLGFSLNTVLLVGISFMSTSTAIGYMVLSNVGGRNGSVFKTIMAAGVSDDIYAILALSLFATYVANGVDLNKAFGMFMLVLGFIMFILSFGRSITDRLIRYSRKSHDDQTIISFSLVLLFFVAYLSQSIEIASVTGAFLAGTILARSPLSYKVITPKIESVSESFFIPLFFIYTGARINIYGLLSSRSIDFTIVSIPLDVVLFLGLVMAVMASKYLGTYIATSTTGGYKDVEIHKISLAMMPMGEYTLVIGQLGLAELYLDTQVYSVLALVVLTTTIMVPVMIRAAYQR